MVISLQLPDRSCIAKVTVPPDGLHVDPARDCDTEQAAVHILANVLIQTKKFQFLKLTGFFNTKL